MARKERTMEERIDSACKKVLLRIPKNLHCEDLYQDIACIYLDIHSKHPDFNHAVICNRIYAVYVNKLIDKYKNDKCSHIIMLPKYNTAITDEDDMMLMITDILGIVKQRTTEREFDIIYRKYVDNYTYAHIGNIFELTGGRVLQIEKRAFRKLRHPKYAGLIQDFCR